jgi:hypothetical protein
VLSRYALFLTGCGLLVTVTGLDAQARSVPPQEAARVVEAAGYLSGSRWNLVKFAGCPQEDAYGTAVFDELSHASLSAWLKSQLALAWKGQIAKCNYPPLNAWALASLGDVLKSGDTTSLLMFLEAIPTPAPPAMRARLWAEAEDSDSPEFTRNACAATAVRGLPPSEQVQELVSAMQRGKVTGDWIGHETGALLRVSPVLVLTSIARAAKDIGDGSLSAAVGAIRNELQAKRLPADVEGLGLLRANLVGRECAMLLGGPPDGG